jgi:hypothetical protein
MANHGYVDLAAMWQGAAGCLRPLGPEDTALLDKALQWPRQPEYEPAAKVDGAKQEWDEVGRRGRNFEEVRSKVRLGMTDLRVLHRCGKKAILLKR